MEEGRLNCCANLTADCESVQQPSLSLKSILFCCCCAYLSYCHQTASDAKYWTIRALFIAVTTSRLEESAPLRSFQWSNVPVDFFELLSTEFAACSKSQSRDNHRKASYPRTQQRDQDAG